MKFIINICIIILVSFNVSFAQKNALTFQAAEAKGLKISYLDSEYKSALHSDPSLAVFTSNEDQVKMQESYHKLLKDLGVFLSDNNFDWENPTKCFNRIYFNADGKIDYFLFNFLGAGGEKPNALKEARFQELLNSFIQDYQFPLKPDIKFAQCSPVTYMPASKED
jgi:hypothetical protein